MSTENPAPAFTTDELRGKYERYSAQYDEKVGRLERRYGIDTLRAELLSRARGSVLNVAIGTGRDIEHIPEECSITGIDLSPEMLQIAEKKAVELDRDIDLRPMNAQVLTFDSDEFDYVISTLSLCTFPDPETALKEMARVSRGPVLLIDHGKSSWAAIRGIQSLFRNQWLKKAGCHIDREPDKLVEAAGLHIVEHRRSFLGIVHAIEANKNKARLLIP